MFDNSKISDNVLLTVLRKRMKVGKKKKTTLRAFTKTIVGNAHPATMSLLS